MDELEKNFTGQIPCLLSNQQHQSTDNKSQQ